MGDILSFPVQSDSESEATTQTILSGNPRIVKGCLEQMDDVDIIVNSTDKSLQLSRGGVVSKLIKREGGPQIQKDLDRKYPYGIQPGRVAVTNGYNLPYKYVYHCSLQGIEKRISHHKIREVVAECLNEAKNQGDVSSIAFPAIGTGGMNFPSTVVKTIYRSLLEFVLENPTFNVYIIIHPSKSDLIDYVKKFDRSVEKSRLKYPATIPGSWSYRYGIHRIQLQNTDDDYRWVKEKFKKTIGTSINIIKIERIENKRLFVAYERFKNNLPNGASTEKSLWHGTKEESIDGIIRYGFDWRLTETARFGKGCYFAVNASYSDDDNYAVPNGRGEKFMILTYVTSGTCIDGDSSITEWNIPNHAQSTTNDDYTIYVTYDDDQQYPAFVVVYKH